MSEKIERSIEELYRDDPERADAVAFGRTSGPSRRGSSANHDDPSLRGPNDVQLELLGVFG